ncbi:MAG TPA: cation:proton antiporter, partial [Candidatus Thermoplasmatota archaeon]|nr:cation:proton antiporter [Candidatus Thermoplasmatota archaeon]
MLLIDLALVGAAAALAGWVCKRLGVPEVLGYILAGVLLGPQTPPFSFVQDVDAVRTLAAFAVVFRMFSLGLEFDPARLAGRWRAALLAGLLEVAVCAGAGYAAAPLLHLARLEGVILGAALGTTSTNILMRALADRGLLARPEARNAAAITIVEDLIAMALLAVLALSRAGQPGPELARDAVELALFALASFSAGAIVIPRILDGLARDYADDLVTLILVATMFLLAGATLTLDAGPAVGAFLSGVVVAGARHAPAVVS